MLLKSPLTFHNPNSLLNVEIANYQLNKDYTQALAYNKIGFFDIRIGLVSSISTSDLRVSFVDASKIVGHNGKKLENSETKIAITGESKFLANIFSPESVKTATKVTKVAGAISVGVSTSLISLSGLFGSVLGVLAKFF